MKTVVSHLAMMALAILVCVSCTKETREAAYTKQEELIEKFVKSHSSSRVTYNEGSTRVTISEGEGMEVNARGKVSVFYAGYNFKSGSISASTLFVTNSESVAKSARWELSGDSQYEPIEVDLSDKDILKGLRNGLEGVKEGEECYILFCGKYAFGKSQVGVVPANAPLAFHIWVETIEN